MQEVLIFKKKKKSVAGQFAAVKYRPETNCWTQNLNRGNQGVDKYLSVLLAVVKE